MEISFLIGAGFSIPAGYPKTEDINRRLKQIYENDIFISTDGAAYFADGKIDPNAFQTENERLFIQEFLRFYNKEILKETEEENFHYEKFFDFYMRLINKNAKIETKEKFDKFIKEFTSEFGDCYQICNSIYIDMYFNQLLADYFRKKKEELNFSILTKPYSGDYSSFLYLLEFFDDKYEKIHLHSLNHDLLMERLSFSDVMKNYFSDGFTKIGSPYYTENKSGKSIRLKLFVDKFDKKFCLYKLHGSLNQYYIDNRNCMVRVERGTYLGKVLEGAKDQKYIDDFYTPDILSGIKEKKRNYKRKIYYKPIFKHFKENLEKSDNLIVIGYSLRDEGINKYIKKYFLPKKDSQMLVIDLAKTKSPLYNYPNVIHYGENLGVQDINSNRILELLSLNQQK
jgi:hypothetical protein